MAGMRGLPGRCTANRMANTLAGIASMPQSLPPEARSRTLAGLGPARIAAIAAVAAVVATASYVALSADGGSGGGTVAGVAIPPEINNMLDPTPPAYAADAFVITDLGNTFKLDIEQPPGINWTQVLLDRINAVDERSRQSVDDLRTETRGLTDDVRKSIEDYIRNNTALLDERGRAFANFQAATNLTITEMINRDAALNASIGKLVQNIYQETVTDNEAAVSALSSQIYYVYYDSPALIMTCHATICDTRDIAPIMEISLGNQYAVYNDPSWPSANIYGISPVHHNARYPTADTLWVTTIPAGETNLYDSIMTSVTHTSRAPNRVIIDYFQYSGTDHGNVITNVMTWGCAKYSCHFPQVDHGRSPGFITKSINTPVGYPYHINMISKESGILHSNGSVIMPPPGPRITKYHVQQDYKAWQMPFAHEWLGANTNHTLKYSVDELIGVGLGHSGKLSNYLKKPVEGNPDGLRRNPLLVTPPLPLAGTTQTWPNCTHMSVCPNITFAFGSYKPQNLGGTYEERMIPNTWPVFISPQMRITTWNEHNALVGSYSTSPQFIDRMNKRIITPTFQEGVPTTEAGKLYDIRGYIRIPFATETPMNVSHVSLRPSSELLDLEEIGRAYIADSANTAANLYNIDVREFTKIGLVDCTYTTGYVECEKLNADQNTLDTTWVKCSLVNAGSRSCATLSDIGGLVVARPDFSPTKNARLSQLEGVYRDTLNVPLVNGYSGFRLVIDGVGIYIEYKDVRSDNHVFLSPPRSEHVGMKSSTPIHNAKANVTTSSQAVASRSGTMSILAVVSATGSVDIANEYYVNVIPSRPPHTDPLSVTVKITKNGEHYQTKNIGVNEHPAAQSSNTLTDVHLVRGGLDHIAKRSVSYDYPSFVFAGTTTVPVAAGDHILFELTAEIEGEIDPWTPASGTVSRTAGTSTAEVAINAASIMMGVG